MGLGAQRREALADVRLRLSDPAALELARLDDREAHRAPRDALQLGRDDARHQRLAAARRADHQHVATADSVACGHLGLCECGGQ